MKLWYIKFLIVTIVISGCAQASLYDFKAGPVFDNYGKHAAVEGVSFPADMTLKVAFDVAEGADAGQLNRKFDTLARFINMHVANGVKLENIHLALVVHGSATLDVLNAKAYKERKGNENANAPLLKALMSKGVRVIVCGQSATAQEVSQTQLIDGVSMDLSAMTAHARLHAEGFSVNPF